MRIETLKERDELKEARQRIRELEAAVADAHIDYCLEKGFLRVACDRLGEEVGAAVYLRPGKSVSADALRDHVKQQLAAFKAPKYIWFVQDPLPRNANGKFVKRTLQDTLAVANAQ